MMGQNLGKLILCAKVSGQVSLTDAKSPVLEDVWTEVGNDLQMGEANFLKVDFNAGGSQLSLIGSKVTENLR
ncbi:MAG: hypothetical protein R3B95_04880 [Nitrospirales bacterium]|nr:hypothetical protein [Nitrospirales bacterium]